MKKDVDEKHESPVEGPNASHGERRDETLRRVFESIPGAVLLTDAAGVVTFAGGDMEGVLGFSENEIHSLGRIESILGDGLFDSGDLTRAGELRDIRRRVQGGDGNDRLVSVHVKRVSIGRGEILYACRTPEERPKEDDPPLREGEVRDALIDALPVPLYFKDLDGRFIACNRAFEAFSGEKRDDIIGRTVHDLAREEVADAFEAQDQELLKNPGIRAFEFVARDSAGASRTVVFHKGTFTRPDGRVGGLAGVVIDHTERTQAEKELMLCRNRLEDAENERARKLSEINERLVREIEVRKRAEESLRREHSFRSAVIKCAAEGICVCNEIDEPPYVKFSVWNDQMTEITGYTLEEANRLGCPRTKLSCSGLMERVLRRVQTPRREDDRRDEEWEFIGADGGQRVANVSTSILSGEDGTVHVLALVHDITRRVAVEREMLQRNRELAAIAAIVGATAAERNLQVILDQALEGALQITGMEGGTLCMVDQEAGSLALCAAKNASPEMVSDLSSHAIGIGDCLCGEAARTGEPFILWDNASGSLYATLEAVRNEGIRFHAAFPLLIGGRAIGVLCIFARNGKQPSERSLSVVQDLCGPIAVAIENARLLEALRAELAERERVEGELHQARREWEEIFQAIGSPAMILDQDCRIVAANRATSAAVGKSAVDLAGARCYEIFHNADFRPEKCPMESLLKGGEPKTVEMEIQALNAAFLVSCTPVRDENNRLQKVIHIATDITARNRAEENLRKSEAMLQTVFDGISEPLVMLDRDGRIAVLNKAAGIYYGVGGLDEAVGKFCFEVFRGRSHPCEGCESPFSYMKGYSGAFERRGPTDPKKLERVAVYPVTNDLGETEATIFRIADITQAKLLEKQLIRSEKLASLGLLISGITHEINNPNSFIVFNIPILREYLAELMKIVDDHGARRPDLELFGMSYPEFREDLFKLLDNMEHGSRRINGIVARLRDFSREQDKCEKRWIDLREVMKNAAAIAGAEIRQRGASLDIGVPESLGPVMADPEGLEQILVNLLINAAHAADKSDARVEMKALLDETGQDRLIIEVRDNGNGMDNKTKERIFDPFFTTKPSTGTGLGLYVCHNLAEGMGGRIEVDSRLGEGSAFRVILESPVMR